MRVKFTKYAGKYIAVYPSQGEPPGNIKTHQWADKQNNKRERFCIDVTGLEGEVDIDLFTGLSIGITTEPDKYGKKHAFPVSKKCYEVIS